MSKVLDLLRAAGVEVYTRRQWGSPREADGSYAARAASPYYRIDDGAPFHYLHIAVTPDTDTPAEGKARARLIETFGYTSPPMVSYQLLVTNEGKVFEGQNYGVKGTHTVNDKNVAGFPNDLNRYGYAVSLMQNVGDEVTDIQVEVVAACFAAAELAGYVKRGAPIFPHRKFAWKSCPGDKAVARLAEIQRLKDELVKNGLENGMSDVWNTPIPKVEDPPGKNGEQPAKWALAHARIRATRAQAEAHAAFEQAKRNGDAIKALADSIDDLAPGVAAAVVKALGDEITVQVEVDLGDLAPDETPTA